MATDMGYFDSKKTDPYVKIKLSTDIEYDQKTKVVKKNCDPVYN